MNTAAFAQELFARMIGGWIASGRPLEPNTVEGFATMAVQYAKIMEKKLVGG